MQVKFCTIFKSWIKSINCFHVFCIYCIKNFNTYVKTSKNPTVNCEQNHLLKSIVSWMAKIHKSVLIKSHKKGCGESFNINSIELHQLLCQKFHEPLSKRKLSHVKTWLPSIISEANKMLDKSGVKKLRYLSVNSCSFH